MTIYEIRVTGKVTNAVVASVDIGETKSGLNIHQQHKRVYEYGQNTVLSMILYIRAHHVYT